MLRQSILPTTTSPQPTSASENELRRLQDPRTAASSPARQSSEHVQRPGSDIRRLHVGGLPECGKGDVPARVYGVQAVRAGQGRTEVVKAFDCLYQSSHYVEWQPMGRSGSVLP